MGNIQEILAQLEVLISEFRDEEDSPNASKIHALVSEARTIAETYPEDTLPE